MKWLGSLGVMLLLTLIGSTRVDAQQAVNINCSTDATGTSWTPCAIAADPCSGNIKTTTPISTTVDVVIVAATAAKKTYICSLVLVASAAEIVSITEGTGSACATGEVALMGSTTGANGVSFAANGGVAIAGGDATIIAGKTANVDVCIDLNTANRVSGYVTWVQQ